MAKLFQTRLKIEEQSIDIIPFNPEINQGSTRIIKPQADIKQGASSILKTIEFNVNQGSVEIKPIQPIKYDTSQQQLSLDLEKAKTDYFVLRQSNLLKQNIPAILPTLSPGLSTIPRPAFTPFPNSISLEDRLRQSPLTSSTTGLQQFFLSDFYTGKLPNISYEYTPNQGSIVLQKAQFNPNQGTITIVNTPFTPNQGTIVITAFDFRPNQGSVLITSFNFNPNQGTETINGVIRSVINIPPFSFLPNQGSVTITPYGFIPNQDAQTQVTLPKTNQQILLGQGGIIDQSGNLVSFIIPQLPLLTVVQGSTTPQPFLTIPTQGSTTPNPITVIPTQGSTTPNPITTIPTQGSTTPDKASAADNISEAVNTPKEVHGEANLNILGYELDRLLARTLPEVKHGSTLNISTLPVSPTEPSSNFRPQFETEDQSNLAQFSYEDLTKVVKSVKDIETRFSGNAITPSRNYIPTYEQPNDENDTFLGTNLLQNYLELANSRIDQKWKTEKEEQKRQEPERLKAGLNRQNIDLQGPLSAQDYKTKLSYTQKEKSSSHPGYIQFKIESVRDGNTISFIPYLTAFSDNWSPTHTDVKYVGRQDMQKVFNGVTRTVSIGFKVPAVNKDSLTSMYQKIQSLIRASVLGKYQSGTPYIIGPTLRITIGNYLINTPCIATSLKIDTNPSEYPWEIDEGKQLTHFLDVSMELFILADNNSRVLDSTGTFISIA
jgi:hypothetical protein